MKKFCIFHKWSEWSYRKEQTNILDLERVCLKCGKIDKNRIFTMAD